MTAAELTEQGIRAYGRGQLGEAERCWRDALALEPGYARAASYLELLVGKLVQGAVGARAGAAPVPLPAPGTAARPAAPVQRSAPAGPVPLPAPPAPAWPDPGPVSGAPPAAGDGAQHPRARLTPIPAAPPSSAGGRLTPVPARRDPGWTAAPSGTTLTGAAPGSTLPGHPGPRGTFAGAPVPGTTLTGQPAPGATLPGHPVPGTTLTGEPAPGATLRGQPVPDAAIAGAARPGATLVGFEAEPGEAVPLPAPAWEAHPGSSAPVTAAEAHATFAPTHWLAPDPAAPPSDDRTTLSAYAPSPWEEGPVAAPTVVLGDEGVGLDLASVEEQPGLHALVPEPAAPAPTPPPLRARSEVELWMEGARELFALGDFSGSLEMIEKILRVDPAHPEARQYLAQNEATLTAMYESKLGPQDAIPRLAIQPEEVMWLNLDHRAGFLLAQVDGTVCYEDLFALSGLPRLDTARILATLLQEGVIAT